MRDRHIVAPGSQVDLRGIDPDFHGEFETKADAETQLKEDRKALSDLQEMLYAQAKHPVLVVLQAMDTGGKDGTIEHVMSRVNPQGVDVTSFKVPTTEELAHDYLWRIHKATPGRGTIMIFNRSHYEDVLIVRVHELVPPDVWGCRYDQINAFEKHLADNGTTILKFFLHISKDEQKRRLQDRLDKQHKQWKFRVADLKERERWEDYIDAYEDVLNRTSTAWAPWYVIPANRKWYRNLAVARILRQTLEGLEMSFPEPEEDLEGIEIPD